MKVAKDDRRSKRTRKLIGDALVSLILEKNYDSITVRDIVERANVGRSTFYAHYYDKDDLFRSEFEELLGVLGSYSEHADQEGDQLVPSLDLFRHIQDHHHLYKALIWGQGIDLLYKTGQDILSSSIEANLRHLHSSEDDWKVPLPILSNYMASTFLALLKWWLENNMPYSPERMDELFQRLVLPGVHASMGVNGQEV